MSKRRPEFVLIRREDFEALYDAYAASRSTTHSQGAVDASAYGRASIGRDLIAARKAAGLTQAELAKRLGVSQPHVSQAEQGKMRVGERYVATVLKACRLPSNWRPVIARPRVAIPREVGRPSAKDISVKGPLHVTFEQIPTRFVVKVPVKSRKKSA